MEPKTIAALHFIVDQRGKKKSYQAIADALGCTRQYVHLLLKQQKPELLGERHRMKLAQYLTHACAYCKKVYTKYEKNPAGHTYCSHKCAGKGKQRYETNPYQRGTPEHAHFNYILQRKHNEKRRKESEVRSHEKHKARLKVDPAYREKCNAYQRLWHRKRYPRNPAA